MFQWLKRRLTGWAEALQLQQEALLLKEEWERATGEPLKLSPEQRRRLAEKAKGIDPETLRQVSVFDPAELIEPDHEPGSTENR